MAPPTSSTTQQQKRAPTSAAKHHTTNTTSKRKAQQQSEVEEDEDDEMEDDEIEGAGARRGRADSEDEEVAEEEDDYDDDDDDDHEDDVGGSSSASKSKAAAPSAAPKGKAKAKKDTDEHGKDWLACSNCEGAEEKCGPHPNDKTTCKRCKGSTKYTRCNFHAHIPKYEGNFQCERTLYYIGLWFKDDPKKMVQPSADPRVWFKRDEESHAKYAMELLALYTEGCLPDFEDEHGFEEQDAITALETTDWTSTQTMIDKFFAAVPRLRPRHYWLGKEKAAQPTSSTSGSASASGSKTKRKKAGGLGFRKSKKPSVRHGQTDCARFPGPSEQESCAGFDAVGGDIPRILDMGVSVAEQLKKKRKPATRYQDPGYWKRIFEAVGTVDEEYAGMEYEDGGERVHEEGGSGEEAPEEQEDHEEGHGDEEEQEDDGAPAAKRQKKRGGGSNSSHNSSSSEEEDDNDKSARSARRPASQAGAAKRAAPNANNDKTSAAARARQTSTNPSNTSSKRRNKGVAAGSTSASDSTDHILSDALAAAIAEGDASSSARSSRAAALQSLQGSERMVKARPSSSPSVSPTSANRLQLLEEAPSPVDSPVSSLRINSSVAPSLVDSPVASQMAPTAAPTTASTFQRITLPREVVVSSRPEAQEIATLDYALQEATLWRDRLIEASDEAKRQFKERVKVPYHSSHLIGPPLDAPPHPSVVTTQAAPTLPLPDGPLRSGSTTSRGKRGGVKAREAAATLSGPRTVGALTGARPSGSATTPRPPGSSTGTRPSGSSTAPRPPAPHGHAQGYGYPSSAAPPGYGYGYSPGSLPPPDLWTRMGPPRYADVAEWPRLEEIRDDEDDGVEEQGSGGRGGGRE